MSPLLIVGILISTALADVSHVLKGAAHPPADPEDINGLAPARSGSAEEFWWMDSNSPLKEAYDFYKKCSNKGNCPSSNNIPIDVKKNPFLNGQIGSGSVSSSFASSFSSSAEAKSNEVPAFHSGTNIDLSNNPFLKGQFATAGEFGFLHSICLLIRHRNNQPVLYFE